MKGGSNDAGLIALGMLVAIVWLKVIGTTFVAIAAITLLVISISGVGKK